VKRSLAQQLLSIQERKISSLIVTLFGLTILGAYFAITGETHDLPPNLVSVLIALITAIAGVNAVEHLAKTNGESEGRDDRATI